MTTTHSHSLSNSLAAPRASRIFCATGEPAPLLGPPAPIEVAAPNQPTCHSPVWMTTTVAANRLANVAKSAKMRVAGFEKSFSQFSSVAEQRFCNSNPTLCLLWQRLISPVFTRVFPNSRLLWLAPFCPKNPNPYPKAIYKFLTILKQRLKSSRPEVPIIGKSLGYSQPPHDRERNLVHNASAVSLTTLVGQPRGIPVLDGRHD
jgi:hypothetical protein